MKADVQVSKKTITKKDYVLFWKFASILGIAIFISIPALGLYRHWQMFIGFLGLMMFFSLLLGLQFSYYANLREFSFKLKDLKEFWFYPLNILMLAGNSILFITLNTIIQIVPMSNFDSLISAVYWQKAWPFILFLYFLGTLIALIYRSRKNK